MTTSNNSIAPSAFLPVLAGLLVVVHTGHMGFTAAHSGQHWVALLYDDFFYYMKVAENWVDGHGSTFNRLVPTNGYHPLWMLVLAAAYAVLGAGEVLFHFVSIVCVGMAGATFWLVREMSRRLGADRGWSCVAGLYVTAFCLRHYITGMEAILCLPLAFWFLLRLTAPDALAAPATVFRTALVGSAMVLSRLDAAVLLLVAAGVVLASAEARRQLTWRHVCAGLLGLMPVALYVLSNLVWHDTLMPVSGMAKQLMPPGATWAVFSGVWQGSISFKLNVVFWLVSLLWCTVHLGGSTFLQRLMWAGMFFPLAYFALLSFRSDWWLSDWYLYPIRVAVACALAHWLSLPTCRAWLAAPWRLALGGAVAAIALLTTSWSVNPGQLAVYQAAAALAEFEKTHPGTYAMGDRAGKVGYLMRHPVVQLEGLVMDKPFLAFMKRSAPLAEVLAHYDADYYVGSSHEPFDRCFTAVEPFQAGPRSPRIVGEFCDEPVARFRFGGVETLVYRVKKG